MMDKFTVCAVGAVVGLVAMIFASLVYLSFPSLSNWHLAYNTDSVVASDLTSFTYQQQEQVAAAAKTTTTTTTTTVTTVLHQPLAIDAPALDTTAPDASPTSEERAQVAGGEVVTGTCHREGEQIVGGIEGNKPIITRAKRSGDPVVCIVVISNQRPEYLNRTVWGIVRHMEVHESLPYELVWVDQATNSQVIDKLAHQYEFDARAVAPKPMGFSWPFNLAFFGMCTAPYLASMEEDWEIIPGIEETIQQSKFIEEAIAILHTDSNLTGVLLRGEREWYATKQVINLTASVNSQDPTMITLTPQHTNQPIHTSITYNTTNYNGTGSSAEAESSPPGESARTTVIVRRCFDTQAFPDSPCQWGGYTNGAAVYDRSRLALCSPFAGTDPECEMTNCHTLRGHCTASVWRNRQACDPLDSHCNRVAEHIGTRSTKQ
ncbi:hypothetical protein Pelo_6568 [Pelomyxa schiedti]|nr:hypothetical protein Pelo_6568 [Pelomyxa schiedti]